MSDWDGTIKVSWRLGVLAAIFGTVIGGAFWAGRFTSRVDDVDIRLTTLTSFSQNMGIRVDLLREHAVADDVGDKAVERRLERIENILSRIEDLVRRRYEVLENRLGNERYE